MSCHNCIFTSHLSPGDDYNQTPCSICELAENTHKEEPEIIYEVADNEKIVSFIKKMIIVTSSPVRTKILFLLIRHPYIKDAEIASRMNIPRRNVSYHTRIIRKTIPELLKGITK